MILSHSFLPQVPFKGFCFDFFKELVSFCFRNKDDDDDDDDEGDDKFENDWDNSINF